MMKWKKKISFYQYEILFQIKPRRPRARVVARGFEKKVKWFKKKPTRTLRKLFEHRRIKQVLGVNLLSAAVLLSQISAPASALQTYPQPELVVLSQVEAETEVIDTETKLGFQAPLEYFRISQGYHMFHLAIDLAAPAGSPLKPIAQGTIERVEYGRWGYGNSVLINHGSGLKSFYAHMGRIRAKKGEEIDIEEMVGIVGSSGRATGPHLHLEIWQNDRPLNPRVVLNLQPSVANLAKAK